MSCVLLSDLWIDQRNWTMKSNNEFELQSPTVRRWKKIYLHVNESAVCRFKKCYEAQIKDKINKKKSPKTAIVNNLRRCPCLLGNKINPLVQKYLKATKYKGGDVNTMVAIATAKALTKRYPLLKKDHLKLRKSWAQTFFCHSGFVHRMKTTGKVKISVRAQKDAELKFLYQIVNNVENQQIPPSLTINFDQTPLKYVQVSSTTMDQKREGNVPIAGISDKKSITTTFSITIDNTFLPMQLIYQGKIDQSLPKVKFPNGFSLSVSESH